MIAYKKVGGLRFLRLGRLNVSWSVKRKVALQSGPVLRYPRRAVAIGAVLATFAIPSAAHASSASNERACEGYRAEHPGFAGPFAVTAHKAVWNGHGFDDEPRQFTCAATPGGEGVAAMQIEKFPARRRERSN